MRKLVFALIFVACIGGFSDSQVISHTLKHTVVAGDTLYGIADKYYDLNENGMCFDEFFYNVREANKSLTANRRYLQVGDVVTVYYYTVAKK